MGEHQASDHAKNKRARHHGYTNLEIANASLEELAQMNPSLMTERQQMAYLLRQTAPPKSKSDSSSSESEQEEKAKKTSRKKEETHVSPPVKKPAQLKSPRHSPRKESEDEEETGCAMCGDANSPDTLLLCSKCDRKYPTQANART